MRRLTRREIVLLSLMGLSALIYAWYVSQKAVSQIGDPGAADGAAADLAASAPRVDLALLEGRNEAYDPRGRDLFKYSKRPPTAAELEAERRRREEEERRRRLQEEANRKRREEAQAQQQQRTPPAPRETGPRPPRIQFSYIGYLGPKDNRIAVFSQGEEVLIARQGDTVLDDFKLVEIRYETVVMGFTDPRFESRTQELEMSRR